MVVDSKLIEAYYCLTMIIISGMPLQEKSFKHCKSLLNKKDMKIMLGIRIHPELKKLLQDLADKAYQTM